MYRVMHFELFDGVNMAKRSLQACCYHLMRKNVTGFRIDHRSRHEGGPEESLTQILASVAILVDLSIIHSLVLHSHLQMMEKLKYQTWYSDGVHGAGDTG